MQEDLGLGCPVQKHTKLQDPIPKITKAKTRGMLQVVEHLSSKQEAEYKQESTEFKLRYCQKKKGGGGK
jgi:hypothetical protein